MPVEFSPEPTPEEREALLLALAALDGQSTEASAWWQAGMREAVEDEPEEASVLPAERSNRTVGDDY